MLPTIASVSLKYTAAFPTASQANKAIDILISSPHCVKYGIIVGSRPHGGGKTGKRIGTCGRRVSMPAGWHPCQVRRNCHPAGKSGTGKNSLAVGLPWWGIADYALFRISYCLRNCFQNDRGRIAEDFAWLAVLEFRKCVRTYMIGTPTQSGAQKTRETTASILKTVSMRLSEKDRCRHAEAILVSRLAP